MPGSLILYCHWMWVLWHIRSIWRNSLVAKYLLTDVWLIRVWYIEAMESVQSKKMQSYYLQPHRWTCMTLSVKEASHRNSNTTLVWNIGKITSEQQNSADQRPGRVGRRQGGNLFNGNSFIGRLEEYVLVFHGTVCHYVNNNKCNIQFIV